MTTPGDDPDDRVVIDTATLPNGRVDDAYGPRLLTASGGSGPYGWSVEAGELPAGLSLSEWGEISGTPRLPGTWSFTARAASADGRVATRQLAITVDGSVRLASLGAGGSHTCGVSTGGALYCWGRNFQGEVGDGTTQTRTRPVFIDDSYRYVAVDGAALHTCAVSVDGAALCWGDNTSGKLGDGTVSNSLVPRRVGGGVSFHLITAGDADFTCGAPLAGAAYCWGRNEVGMLGDGTTTFRLLPTEVEGGLAWTDLSAGGGHACGVATSGEAYCWGFNGVGQVGNGRTTVDGEPTPQAVTGGRSFAAISAGDSHTCGITTSGEGYCWGSNRWGELGNGTVTRSTTAVAVSGGLEFGSISATADYNCGLTTGGAAYCWGRNAQGQLGDGTTLDRFEPTPVSAPGQTFVALVTGNAHTCALNGEGAAFCWGWNANGQLGDGTTTGRETPVPVAWPGG